MEKMIMAVFNTAPQAFKGVIALKDLHRAGDIKLYSTLVIAKDVTGTVAIKQASEREMQATPLGLLAGILLGTLAGPIALVAGGLIGGLTGLIIDLAKTGISADLLEEGAKALLPGKAALLAEIDETEVAAVDMKLMNLGGHIQRWKRSEFVDSKIIHELDTITSEPNQI